MANHVRSALAGPGPVLSHQKGCRKVLGLAAEAKDPHPHETLSTLRLPHSPQTSTAVL